MARSAEIKTQRFLRVSELTNLSPLSRVTGIVHNALRRAGFEGFANQPEPTAPQFRDVERSFGIRKGLRLGETRKVARAMSEMGASGEQGTALHATNFRIDVVKIDKKGRARVKKLSRLRWILPVKLAHYRDVVHARDNQLFTTQTDLISTLKRRNPIKQALARENAEAKILKQAYPDAVVSGLYGWRANLLAKIAEGNPERVANGMFSSFLRPGQSRGETFGQLHTMMLQIADEQLDPSDKIHGPFEAGVKALQKFQRGIGGAVLTSIVGDIPLFNKVTSYMIDGNKVASRDARAELSPRGLARVIRRIGFIDRYGVFYGKKANKKGFGGWVNRLLYPPDSLVEEATDRRMQRGNIAKLAKTQAILLATNLSTPLERAHQQVVAQEFVRSYDAPAPQLEILTHTGFQSIESATGKVTDSAQKAADVAGDLAKKIGDKAAGLVPGPLRRRQPEPVAEKAPDARLALREAMEAYGGKPMSTRQQVDAILAHVDNVLAVPLTAKERARWERAKAYAIHFDLLSQIAQSKAGSVEAPQAEA